MQLNQQGFSYGTNNNVSVTSLQKSKTSFPLPIPTIPEESYAKDKQFDDHPKKSSQHAKNLARHSTIVSSSLNEKSFSDNRSLMMQNSVLTSMSGQKGPGSSMIDSGDVRRLKRFGTFAEPGKSGINPSSSTIAHSPSSTNNVNMNVKFLEKADWFMDSQCHICTRAFNKMNRVFEHHCRACGNAVCGECSTKKINESRVCDSCFYKANHLRAEERRKDQLKSKNATMKTYKKQLLREKDDLTQLIQKRYDLDKKVKEDKEEQKKCIDSLQKERDKATEVLTKKKDTNVKLKESLDVDKTFLKEKEVEYEELKNKINSLKLQVMQKKNNYESKKEELQRLFRQKMRYEESPSFLNIIGSMPGDDTASIHDANASTFSTGVGGISNRLNFLRGSTKWSTKV